MQKKKIATLFDLSKFFAFFFFFFFSLHNFCFWFTIVTKEEIKMKWNREEMNDITHSIKKFISMICSQLNSCLYFCLLACIRFVRFLCFAINNFNIDVDTNWLNWRIRYLTMRTHRETTIHLNNLITTDLNKELTVVYSSLFYFFILYFIYVCISKHYYFI